MDQLNLNLILGREECEKKLIDALQYFEENNFKKIAIRYY